MRRYQGIVFDSSRWDGFELRPGDIIISTPPKCGTTWTQMICALLVLQEPELPLPLDTLSPWVEQPEVDGLAVGSEVEAHEVPERASAVLHLVDDEVESVESPDRLDVLLLELVEEQFVEPHELVVAVEGRTGEADRLVFGIRRLSG